MSERHEGRGVQSYTMLDLNKNKTMSSKDLVILLIASFITTIVCGKLIEIFTY